MKGFLNIAFTGFDFRLRVEKHVEDGLWERTATQVVDDAHQEMEYFVLLGQAIKMLVVLGLMIADATLPTTQCIPEFLYVDVVSIGGFSKIMTIILPRITQLGITSNMRAAPFFEEPTARSALISVLLMSGVTVGGLYLVVYASIHGADLDILYWLYPSCCALCTIGTLGVFTCLYHGDPGNPPWAAALGLHTETFSLLQGERNRRLSMAPPYWLQVLYSLPSEIRDKVDAVCVSGIVMKCKDEDGSSTEVSVLALDADVVAKIKQSGISQDDMPILRVPASEVADIDVTCGSMLSAMSDATKSMPGADVSTKCEKMGVMTLEMIG